MVSSVKVFVGGTMEDPAYIFSGDKLESVETNLSTNLVGGELPIDTFTPTVYYDQFPTVFKPTDYTKFLTVDDEVLTPYFEGDLGGDMAALTYGTPVWFVNSDGLLGKFFLKNVERVGKYKYVFNCISAIGLLERQVHTGGIYAGDSFGTVLNEIMDGTGINYTVDSDIANEPIHGWLPFSNKRDNLYQLIFAYNVTILKEADGSLHFTWIEYDTSGTNTPSINSNVVYNEGSYSYPATPSRVEVTEHAYRALTTIDPEVVYNNEADISPADYAVVTFENGPVITSSITPSSSNIIIHETHVNYMVVSGIGEVTAIPYTHSTRVYSMDNPEAEETNVMSCTDATLVSLVNSNFVAKRMLRYYCDAKVMNSSFVVTNQKCGEQFFIVDPFDERQTAFITKMRMLTSSKLKAECEMVTNYIPVIEGNLFTKYVLLDEVGSSTWYTPQEVLDKGQDARIRVIMVQGGYGGEAGENGANGQRGQHQDDSTSPPTLSPAGGQGGSGGTAGTGGKFRIIELTGGSVLSSFEYTIGAGGEGAADTNVHGTEGGHTSFGAYSTEIGGAVLPEGMACVFNPEIVMGVNGEDGVRGGNGGMWNDQSSGHTVTQTTSESVSYKGRVYPGQPYNNQTIPMQTLFNGMLWNIAKYGYGGGASAGGTGNAGGAPYFGGEAYNYYNDCYYAAVAGGAGGNGANAPYRTEEKKYGCGGDGGHGGGGGGQGGASASFVSSQGQAAKIVNFGYVDMAAGGTGGLGSPGSNGGNGCILIYY